MATSSDKREVRVGLSALPLQMTEAQAKRYGDKNMPGDLRRAGFKTLVFTSCPEINFKRFYRISYGMATKAA